MDKKIEVNKNIGCINDETFNHYFNKYQSSIKAYIYRMLGNTHTAEEVSQDVFVKFYRNIKSLNPANLKNWLYTVAHNEAVNHIRNGSKGEVALDDRFEEPAYMNTPERCMERQDERAAIKQIFSRLPKKQAAAILLKDIKGLSYREIADTMHLSCEAVRCLIYRGRQNFIKYYEEMKSNEL